MPKLRFDEAALEVQLSRMSMRARLAFALLCCERMLPNYRAFATQEDFGEPDVLRQTLDEFWDFLEKEDEIPASAGKTRCEELAPDTEEFESLLTSPALDAAVAVATLFDVVGSESPNPTLEIACLARDTVDMYVQEIESMDSSSPTLEDQIADHVLMQKEIEKQQSDLALLDGEWSVDELRSRSADSNIALT
ncbi:DUF416 family protein [Roseimaritima sediminicola]|uniref:DUF416 family protein n=1 Tax=Roseimaritima sediminicola TaxID=2662066 RepID=UPI0012983F3A|nr:DUF416 family protein [Roseimaritima sediminicola]